MAGPNEQKLNQALAGGSAGSLRRRAKRWKDQAKVLSDAADDIDAAARGLEPVYSGSADSEAAQASMAKFSKAVRKQHTRMLKVASGLEDAASAMETAQDASLGPGVPTQTKTDPTPAEQKAFDKQATAAANAREQKAKAVYDHLVTGYAKAGSQMSQAAPEVPAPAGGRSGGRDGGGSGTGAPVQGVPANGDGGSHHGQAHIEGYSSNVHGTTVDLSPTGETGNGQAGTDKSSPTPGTVSGIGESGTGGGVLGSGVNPAQATGGTVAGGAGLAGGIALGKGGGALRGVLGGGRSAPSPTKPVALGQTSRSGSGGVLGRGTPASGRTAGSAAAAAKTGSTGAGARGASPSGARGGGAAGGTSRGTGAAGTRGGASAGGARGTSSGARAAGTKSAAAGKGTSGTTGRSATGRTSASRAAAAKSTGTEPGAAGRGTAARGATGNGAARGGAAQTGANQSGANQSGAGKTGANQTGAARGGAAGRGTRGRSRDQATGLDHIVFEDEQAWLEDGETNPGVIR